MSSTFLASQKHSWLELKKGKQSTKIKVKPSQIQSLQLAEHKAQSKASTQTKLFYTSPSKSATNVQLGKISADLCMSSNADVASSPVTFCSQPCQLCSAPSAAHTPKSPFPALSEELPRFCSVI